MKDRVNGMDDLQKRIADLEEAERMHIAEIRYSASQLASSITPGNLLKNAVSNIASSPKLRSSLIDTVVGMGAGFVGKKLFVGRSRNIFKKLGGTALEFVLANLVRKRIPALRERVKSVNGVSKD